MLDQYSMTIDGKVENTEYNIAKAPLYFVRGGDVWLEEGSWSGGIAGLYWSRSVENDDNDNRFAYTLYFAASDLQLEYANDRYMGYSLRCLSTN